MRWVTAISSVAYLGATMCAREILPFVYCPVTTIGTVVKPAVFLATTNH